MIGAPASIRIMREVRHDSAITARDLARRMQITVPYARRVVRALWRADMIEPVTRSRAGRHWRSRQLELEI
ncbi:MarR family transcriptional regulator [Kaustia mangrovi]|uniref:MarR family transcriptional regulator n=1 Tax=Kaustia mangrovi TaxID=2593653 RepID=A0A7S8C632_9HYPH|nr:winged helix-turn-helix transcriptional regulator [Kaustia mangrovi]QPC44032.1 MarR family transcriptional regulator [Kaustia mangrovi]